MSRHLALLILPLLLGGTVLALEESTPAGAAGSKQLVLDLGSKDFATREKAGKRLDAIGEAALPALRPACRSADPEVARRALTLVARIERRVENRRALAPTLVELNAENAKLSDVIDDLAKQSAYKLTVDSQDASLTSKLISVKAGKVPFWKAVLHVCDVADLQIASVSGYVSPTSPISSVVQPQPLPTLGGRTSRRTRGAVEIISSPNIVLEPRGQEPKRPAAVFGAVMVEAFPVPLAARTTDADAAILQVWPEPKLNWQEVKGLRIDRARDAAGQFLAQIIPDADSRPVMVAQGNGVIVVQQANGGVVLINQPNSSVPTRPSLTVSPRQTLMKLKPGSGDQLQELTGSILGTVRSKSEPLVELKKLKPGMQADGSHPAGAELKATLLRGDDGSWQAIVELGYDQSAILPSNAATDPRLAPRIGGFQSGGGVSGIMGVHVIDAKGEPFDLSLTGSRTTIRRVGLIDRNWIVRGFTFSVLVPEGSQAVPDGVSFSGTYPKVVEVPFEFAKVPVARAK
jgi:hypothetical protein